MKKIERVAIIGMGAVGASYAKWISKYAPDIKLYGVVRSLDNFWGTPLQVNDEPLQVNYRTMDALKTIPLDMILVCVKSYDLEDVIVSMREIVGENTVILSLMNGLTSEPALVEAFGPEHVLYATILNADMARNGHYIICNSIGRVFFGSPYENMDIQSKRVQEFFRHCHIDYHVTQRIEYYLWKKMLINVGFTQTSTVYQQTFGNFRKNEKALDTMRAAQKEVIVLAKACGVELREADIFQWEADLAKLSPDGRSSMLQDYWMNRRLETDIFCDYICALGQEKGIPIPANLWLREQLHSMIKKRSELPTEGIEVKARGLSARQGYLATPEKIANQMRVDLIKGNFAAGEKLVEKELAEQFGASRSSVRTALQILSNEGLLRTLPNGRREVIEFTEKQLKDLYNVRWLIENQALTLLLEKDQTVHPKLAQALSEIEMKYHSSSVNMDWNDLDVSFHRSLVASADNMFLTNAWEGCVQLWYAMLNFSHPVRTGTQYASEFFGTHRHIYELILAGDRTVLPELKRHIEEERETMVMIMNSLRRGK